MRLTSATRQGLSISVATGVYAVSFGALSTTAGLDVVETQLLSLLMFTGGSQFGFVGVIGSGGAPMAAVSAASLLGIRNAVYGIQMNALLRPRGPLRLLAAHVTIDESTAVASGQDDPDEQRRGFWVTGLGVLLLWNVFTLVGSLVGSALADPRRLGLDGAAVAAFLGLLWPRLRARDGRAVAAVCALVTLLTTPELPPGIPVLVAAAVALGIGWWRRGRGAPVTEPAAEHDGPPGIVRYAARHEDRSTRGHQDDGVEHNEGEHRR